MPLPLKRVRRHAGLSLDALAAASGIDRVSIWRIETGQQVPRPATAKALADAMGVQIADVDELANGERDRSGDPPPDRPTQPS